jgi:hypothetical protein
LLSEENKDKLSWLKFNYTISAADGYGNCKKNEVTGTLECDGMVKELVEKVRYE